MISVAVLFFIIVGLSVIEGIIFDVIVFDFYPQLYGCNFVFYGLALIMLIWGIVELVKGIKRRKRQISRGQLHKKPKNFTSTAALTFRAEPKAKNKGKKRKKKR